MGTGGAVATAATAEKKESLELMTFTCWDGHQFIHVRVEDPTGADKKNDQDSVLIVEGKLKDIGARQVKEESGISIDELGEKLEPGVHYTITIEDPIRIANAIYSGEIEINEDKFLAFVKNGIRFWVLSEVILFNSISRKRL